MERRGTPDERVRHAGLLCFRAPAGEIRVALAGAENDFAGRSGRPAQWQRSGGGGVDRGSAANAVEKRRALGDFHDSGYDRRARVAGVSGKLRETGAAIEGRDSAVVESPRADRGSGNAVVAAGGTEAGRFGAKGSSRVSCAPRNASAR